MKKILPLLLLTPTLANAECTPAPDGASIGYTQTSCETLSLKCPFDQSKLFCLPCDSSFQYTCDASNEYGDGTSCNGKYQACCQTDCIVGAIYYTDGTCSSCINNNKSIAGIVIKDNELIMSAITNITWGGYGADINALSNITTETSAKADYNGKTNTATIVAQLGTSSTDSAAVYCYNYSPTNMESTKNSWYLPAFGELQDYICNNFNTLNSTINKLGWSRFNQQFLWSSTESSYLLAWYAFSNNGATNFDCSKACSYSTTCILAIN